tara:strand:+ start:3807 stop:6254 length:2448 start_codon:yes stop_codon:yes gene_type:complete
VKNSTRPLDGIRVLDIAEGIAGPFCAKLLGDLGAQVTKIEQPGQGDQTRSFGPFPDGDTDLEKSATFFYLNTSKRSVVLDLDAQENREVLAALVARSDIVVASEIAEELDAREIGFEQIQAWNPRAVLTTVTGFGSFGPHSSYGSSHLIACAVGGWSQLCGMPDREPLQVGGSISETLTGSFAAAASLLAILGRETHGRGDHVDLSVQEAVIAGASMPTLIYEYYGFLPQRFSNVGSGAGAAFIMPTDEGYVGLNALTAAQWRLMCEFLGRKDIVEDPKYHRISWARPDETLEEVRTAFKEALAGRTAEELFHEAETWRIPFGLITDLEGLFAMPPLREGDFFVPLEHPASGTVEVPGIPYKSTAGEPLPTRPPLLGEHTEEVLAELKEPDSVAATKAVTATGDTQSLPLDGLRILDLSMFFAGPVAAQIAADAGAEVIKVESIQRIDGWRGSGVRGESDLPDWERSPNFNWVNRSKRGITLNLTDKRGTDILKRMVKDADVVIENYTPRVMDKFGLGYDVLKEINPRLIMMSMSGFGRDVSWRDYVAFGMSTEQMSGFCHLTGYEDGDPLFTGTTGGDIYAGVMGANVLLAAIHHSRKTGEGQHIDFSQLAACNLYVGDVMTGWSLAGHDPGRMGNAHVYYAPQGIYPCRDDRWIGITCRTDQDWRALTAIMCRDDLQSDNALDCAAGRAENRTVIDTAIAAWTRDQDALELMHRLQRAGAPAGAVMTGRDLLDDPHLAVRGSFLPQDRPELGVKHYPNQPYRFRYAQSAPNRRAPLLGEHTSEVLTELAGLTDDDIADLIIDDVVGTEPIIAR